MTEELRAKAEGFGQEISELLDAVLPQAPPIDVLGLETRVVVRPGLSGEPLPIPLFVKGERLASLDVYFFCRWDADRQFLAIRKSSFALRATLDRAPLLRFEYEHEKNRSPEAHIHVHAHRGALSHLLSKAEHPTPHDFSSLHVPVGGTRLRPCLEDCLQFLIVECGFDHHNGWEDPINEGRERWRRRQVSALVRAVPSEAVQTLERLGFRVAPPPETPVDSVKTLTTW